MASAQLRLSLSAAMAVLAASPTPAATPPEKAVVEDADICAVLLNPFAYDHKLIRVTGFIARDFETFWIESSECKDAQPVWIEYGGPKPADGPEWHDSPENPSEDAPLVIEGIKTSLVTDKTFRKFDSATKALGRGKRAHATLIGWIVAAGVEKDEAGNEQAVGYGPYGMYSLLVVQRVEAVSRR